MTDLEDPPEITDDDFTVSAADAPPPAGGVLGVKRPPDGPARYAAACGRCTMPGLPPGTAVWVATSDHADLALPDAEFLPLFRAESADPARGTLEAAFPAPEPGLTRVVRYGDGDFRRALYLVLPAPYPRCAAARDDVAAMTGWAAAHGDLLLRREAAEALQSRPDYRASDLVVAPLAAADFAFVKSRPSKAQARRTRDANATATADRAYGLAAAAAAMRQRIDDLADRLRGDLLASGLGQALDDTRDVHRADDADQPRWRSRRRGTRHDPSPRYRRCLDRLYGMARIHAKFRGRAALRRHRAWAALRAVWRDLPAGLDTRRWGLHPENEAVAAWWAAEMRARPPRPRAGPAPSDDDREDTDDV